MVLNEEEKAMLAGDFGAGVALAMKIQVAIGEAYEAEKMVPVTRTHVALSNQEADLWFAEKLVRGGATCRVSPTVNPGFNLEYFKNITTISAEDEAIITRTRVAYKTLGATLTYDCTPYLEKNVPRFGEITAYSESSATPYINSVYGARSNREAAQSALCAAVTGRVPLYGYLLTEKRKGEILVEVEADMKTDFDYQMLGYFTPKKTGFKIPVFRGALNPTPAGLMNLGAQLNTGGNVAMYHIVGFTPEAPTLEAAFQGDKPLETVRVTNADLQEMQRLLSEAGGKIDFALFGCPHFSITQVGRVAELVSGRRLAVPLWIMTSSLTKELAKRMGYLETLNAAGGDLVEDTCMDQPSWKFLNGKKGITDSPKCAYYTKRRNISFVIRELDECIQASLVGQA